jgi:SAM-dependent methyltransferase
MLLEHVQCDLCASSNYVVRYRKPDNWLRRTLYQFAVVECLKCGLVYVNPRPTLKSMADFYPDDYHSGREPGLLSRRYDAQKAFLPDLSAKRVLDIGCARGDFLSYLLNCSSVFEPHGVDVFSPGVNDRRIYFNQNLFTGVGYESGYFDLIMAWAVFEHLHRPMEYFSEAARVLKQHGQLIILVTNSESIYGRYAFAEDVPRHTYHFSKKTLRRYGEKVGLELKSVDYRDDVFDGRGFGAFKYGVGRLVGFSWEKSMLNRLRLHHQLAMNFGTFLDRLVFSLHWEAKLQRSGIMVATYEKA